MSLHERDSDCFQSCGYVEHRLDVDLEDHAAVLGHEVDPAEGQPERSGRRDREPPVLDGGFLSG